MIFTMPVKAKHLMLRIIGLIEQWFNKKQSLNYSITNYITKRKPSITLRMCSMLKRIIRVKPI